MWVRGCVGSVGQTLAWVAWVAWVHKILVWVTWVHKILALVAWVEILAWLAWLAWIKKAAWVNALLFNHTLQRTSSIEHYIIVPTEFIKLYSILTLFRVFLIQMKPVCDAFLDLFSNLFSLVFFLNCGYLFCLTCKNNKKTMKEQGLKRQRKTKKQYSIAKKNL